MIPVTLLVILPKMVQSNLDSAKFVLNNVTMATCDSWAPDEKAPVYAELFNDASLQNTGPVSVTVHDYKVTLSAYKCYEEQKGMDPQIYGSYDCGEKGLHAKEFIMGNFTAPENTLQKGDNNVTNKASLAVGDQTATLGAFVNQLLKGFTDPNRSEILVFTANSVDVSVMGYKVKGLSFSKRMACKYLAYLPDAKYSISEKYCPKWNAKDVDSYEGQAIAMRCTLTDKVVKSESPFRSPSDEEAIQVVV